MTTATAEPISISLTEFEAQFDEPCEALHPKTGIRCDKKAEWIGYSTHGTTCPATAKCCDFHKGYIENDWASRLRLAPVTCRVCKGQLAGNVSDHLRWIKL